MRMTKQELDDLNRARIARGGKPLTFTEPPIQTAVSFIGAPTVKELRKLPKQKRGPSHLEEKFLRLWTDAGGPPLEREFKFHTSRKWRVDFVDHATHTAFEIEGGAFGGRHTRAAGFFGDADKYLELWHAGYSLVRLTSPQLTPEIIGRIVAKLTR